MAGSMAKDKSMILTLSIIGNSSSAQNALTETTGSASKFKDGMAKANVAAIGTLTAIGGLAKVSGEAASALQQSSGAVEAVFKGAASEVKNLSDNAADAVGLSKNQYNELASVLGAQLQNLGVSQEDLVGTTDDLIVKSADLAATMGTDTASAVEAVSALFRGERDPIEKYGVKLKQADINAKMAAMGLSGLTGEAAQQAETQASLALLTERTAYAQGRFADEADSAAGQQERMNAHWEDAKAALGQSLLPLMTEWARSLAGAAEWIEENSTLVTILVGVVGGLAAAIVIINATMAAYNAVIAVTTALKLAENAAWLASPITWIVIGIVAAIALLTWAFIEAYNRVGWFRDGVDSALSWIKDMWNAATYPIREWGKTMDAVGGWIDGILDGIGTAIDWVIDKLTDLKNAWNDFWSFSDGGDVSSFSTFATPPMTFAAQPAMALTAPATIDPQADMSAQAPTRRFSTSAGGSAPTGAATVTYNVTVKFEGLVTDPAAVGREIETALHRAGRSRGQR